MTPEELEQLYRIYGAILVRRAARVLGGLDEARDVVQEVFVKLLQKPVALDPDRPPLVFLHRITTNACLNRLRNQTNRKRLLDATTSWAPNGPAIGTGVRPEQAEDSLAVRRILAVLPDDLARIAIHAYLDEMTHAEIAEMIGCSRRRIGHALERIAAQLRAAHPDVGIALEA